ncbi:MAG: hypothetical protein K2J71_08505 [Oscillospiraceae bacterium]|nr:hypothetical protein [Oscillospiraceae bacterium]
MKVKPSKAIIIILVTLLLSLILQYLIIPISRPDNAVRSYVLHKIPINTSWDETVSIIDSERWKIVSTHDSGLRINYQARHVDFDFQHGANKGELVGVTSMEVKLGEFYSPFHTAVFAYIAFDENDKLTEVYIHREIDAT